MNWLLFAGLVLLVIGLWTARRELAESKGLAKLIVLGPVFTAAPLAAFGAEHLTIARNIMPAVPVWMPGRLFWVYLVGFALIAAALSLVLSRYVRLSTTLLGMMILSFVLMIHLPNVLKVPGDRILWAVLVRDTAFAGGALAMAGTFGPTRWLILFGRIVVGAAAVFFGVEQILHPGFAPGVPLGKQTPDWFPVRDVWGYLSGVIELASGALILIGWRARDAAAVMGALLVLLTLFLYTPILVVAPSKDILEAINYVADTLMFGGLVLLLARALGVGAGSER